MTPVKYMTSEAAAQHLGFVKPDGTLDLWAFRYWVRTYKPKTHRLGKRLRFRQVDLDACVEVKNEQGEAS